MTRVPSFKRRKRNGGELGGGERVCRGDGVAHCQDQAHLIGQRAATAGAVGSQLRLVQFDQVLGPGRGRSRGSHRHAGFNNQILRQIKSLRYIGQPKNPPPS